MGFVRKKIIGSKEYYYYIHSTKPKRIEKYLGISKPTKEEIEEIEKENYAVMMFLKDVNLDEIKKKYRKWITSATIDAKEKFKTNFISLYTYNSNRIEGSKLSFKDTKMCLEQGLTPKDKPLRDVKEAENHKEAYLYLIDNLPKLTLKLILYLHAILKKGVTQDAGKFRGGQIFVSDLVPIKADLIEQALTNIIEVYNASELHVVEKIAQFHADFEKIHPFFDGNGRVGRLIINFMLMKEGYPPVILRNKNKRRYYNALKRADGGNLLFLVKYIYLEMMFISKFF